MLKIEDYMTIITLCKSGKSQREISLILGRDRKTIRKIIKHYQKTGTCEPIIKQAS